jgi:hypothetical protein
LKRRKKWIFIKLSKENDIELKEIELISARIFIRMSIEWTDFPSEFDLSGYQGNREGRIRNKKSKYILSPKPRKDTGYVQVSLEKDRDKGRTSYRLHNLLAKLFIPNPKNKRTVDHINRIKTDNRVVNLRWATHQEQNNNRTKPKKIAGVPVYQLDDRGKKIKMWGKISDAERELGISLGKITMVCKGQRKAAGGYGWRYVYQDKINGEEWKKYKDIEVSSEGRVKAVFGRVNYGRKIACGYMNCSPTKNDLGKHELVHDIVAELFIPNPSPDDNHIVNHKDGIKTNNKMENLEWTDNSGNGKHAHENGLVTKSKRLNIAVDQYDLEGNFIKTFESMGEAGRELGIHHGVISKVCNGIFKQTHGYVFKHHDEDFVKNRSGSKGMPIKVYDLEMNFIKKFKNPTLAAKELNVSPSNIHLACKGIYKQTGGYRFKYAKQ